MVKALLCMVKALLCIVYTHVCVYIVSMTRHTAPHLLSDCCNRFIGRLSNTLTSKYTLNDLCQIIF